jgi:hypothetical protein
MRQIQHALSVFRPPCQALITPSTLVFDSGLRVRPWVRHRSHSTGSLTEQFQTVVAELLQRMDEQGVTGRRLKLVVSDFWARPAVLTLPSTSLTDQEMDILLSSHYRRTYGDLMEGWRWCWDQQPGALIAVAWPGGGLDALKAGLSKRNCVLACAKPLGTEVISQLPAVPGALWCAILANSCLTLMRMQDGKIQDWCVVANTEDTAGSVPLALNRESAKRGDPCRNVVIIDLHDLSDTFNPASLRSTLQTAGWASRFCVASDIHHSLTWPLHQATLLSPCP